MTQFYGVVTIASDVAEHMQKHVSWPVDLGIIHSHYFSTFREALTFVQLNASDKYGSVYLYYFTVIFLCPIFIYWGLILKHYIQKKVNIWFKLIVLLAVFSVGITIATFWIQADWCRYTNLYFTGLFIFMYLMILEPNGELGKSCEEIHAKLAMKLGKYWYAIFAIYLMCIAYGGGSSITQVTRIPDFFLNLMNMILGC